MSFRFEMEPQKALARDTLPVIRPLFARQLQQDLDDLAQAATLQGVRPQQDQQQRQVAASEARLARALGWVSVGLGLGASRPPFPSLVPSAWARASSQPQASVP